MNQHRAITGPIETQSSNILGDALLGAIRQAVREEFQALMGQNGHHEVDTLISADTAAKRWEVPETWIEEKARRGELPCVKLGHYLRFRTIDLERFIKEHRK